MTKLRPIVKDAFKCRALEYQFEVIDVEDGILTSDDVEAEVNEKYSDAYILGEADNRLDICHSGDNMDYEDYRLEARELERFINKYSRVMA